MQAISLEERKLFVAEEFSLRNGSKRQMSSAGIDDEGKNLQIAREKKDLCTEVSRTEQTETLTLVTNV